MSLRSAMGLRRTAVMHRTISIGSRAGSAASMKVLKGLEYLQDAVSAPMTMLESNANDTFNG